MASWRCGGVGVGGRAPVSFWNLKVYPSDLCPPGPHLPILPKQSANQQTYIQIYEPRGTILIQPPHQQWTEREWPLILDSKGLEVQGKTTQRDNEPVKCGLFVMPEECRVGRHEGGSLRLRQDYAQRWKLCEPAVSGVYVVAHSKSK